MLLDIVTFAIFATFGIALNLAFFAVYKYRVANNLHREKQGREYPGPLPRHIWKTAVGTMLLLLGGVVLVLDIDKLTAGHWMLLGGFIMLALGMHELLNFENHRIKHAGAVDNHDLK